jgi:hypothetical protein
VLSNNVRLSGSMKFAPCLNLTAFRTFVCPIVLQKLSLPCSHTPFLICLGPCHYDLPEMILVGSKSQAQIYGKENSGGGVYKYFSGCTLSTPPPTHTHSEVLCFCLFTFPLILNKDWHCRNVQCFSTNITSLAKIKSYWWAGAWAVHKT